MKGYVYVISNRAMPGIYKIGFTLKDPALRAKELESTGIPHPFTVEYEILVDAPHMLEKKVHQTLSLFNENKEWFRCDVSACIAAIKNCHEGDIYYERCAREENFLALEKEKQKNEKLYKTLQMESDDQKIKVSDTAQHIAVAKLTGGYEMVIVGTISILCGIYFLVCNVLWISMSEDIQNLGLLNTIGATERQISKIYRRQMQWILLRGSLLGVLLSVLVLTVLVPNILGVYYYQEMGGKTLLYFFRPEILLMALVFVNGILWIASEKVIRKIVNMSCVESIVYDEKVRVKQSVHSRKMIRKRTTVGEMFYIAWKNVSRNKARFIITCLSIFLGVLSYLVMNVIVVGSDYMHVLENRPDFLLAGEFSEYGKSQGYGNAV